MSLRLLIIIFAISQSHGNEDEEEDEDEDTTEFPTLDPTTNPTIRPTISPTNIPSYSPTTMPSIYPSMQPSMYPTPYPSIHPTISPSMFPTISPLYSTTAISELPSTTDIEYVSTDGKDETTTTKIEVLPTATADASTTEHAQESTDTDDYSTTEATQSPQVYFDANNLATKDNGDHNSEITDSNSTKSNGMLTEQKIVDISLIVVFIITICICLCVINYKRKQANSEKNANKDKKKKKRKRKKDPKSMSTGSNVTGSNVTGSGTTETTNNLAVIKRSASLHEPGENFNQERDLRQNTCSRSTVTSQQITELELSAQHNDNMTEFTDLENIEYKQEEESNPPGYGNRNINIIGMNKIPSINHGNMRSLSDVPTIPDNNNNNGFNEHDRQSTASTIFRKQILKHISEREKHIKKIQKKKKNQLELQVVNSNSFGPGSNSKPINLLYPQNSHSANSNNNLYPQNMTEIRVSVIEEPHIEDSGDSTSNSDDDEDDDDDEPEVMNINVDNEGNFNTNDQGAIYGGGVNDKDEGNEINSLRNVTKMIDEHYATSSDDDSNGDGVGITTQNYNHAHNGNNKMNHNVQNNNINEERIIEIKQQFDDNFNRQREAMDVGQDVRRHNSNNTNSNSGYGMHFVPHFIDNESDILEIDSMKFEGDNISIAYTEKSVMDDKSIDTMSISFNPSHGSNFVMMNNNNNNNHNNHNNHNHNNNNNGYGIKMFSYDDGNSYKQ